MGEPKPQDSSIWANVTIVVALMGCIGAIAAALVGILPDLINKAPITQPATFNPVENTSVPTSSDVSIPANDIYSGSSTGGDLLSFSNSERLAGLGNTKDNYVVKSFFSFYLGELPLSIEVTDASLYFQCETVGSPENLGKLILQNYSYEDYDKSDFYNIPPYEQNWYVAWSHPNGLLEGCRTQSSFSISGHSLTQLIQQNISGDWIQFVFYFENQSAIASQSDNLVIFNVPLLLIKYKGSR